MSDADLQTFLAGGLIVLIGAVVFLAWSAWRWIDRARDMEELALGGVGHELRINLIRMLRELGGVGRGELKSPEDIRAPIYPQLTALLSQPNEVDRGTLSLLRAQYDGLEATKGSLRRALTEGGDVSHALGQTGDALIDALTSLYLWEAHNGKLPEEAPSTRSWAVRDWMKAHKFENKAIPDVHLRDAVVERLRERGMVLTPQPLTKTASEYFAMRYDRKADPHGPFGRRRKPEVENTPEEEPAPEVEETTEAEVASDPNPAPEPIEPPVQAEPGPQADMVEPAAPQAEPAASTDAPAAPLDNSDPGPAAELEAAPESVSERKPDAT